MNSSKSRVTNLILLNDQTSIVEESEGSNSEDTPLSLNIQIQSQNGSRNHMLNFKSNVPQNLSTFAPRGGDGYTPNVHDSRGDIK
jgi:hypothetical protein